MFLNDLVLLRDGVCFSIHKVEDILHWLLVGCEQCIIRSAVDTERCFLARVGLGQLHLQASQGGAKDKMHPLLALIPILAHFNKPSTPITNSPIKKIQLLR